VLVILSPGEPPTPSSGTELTRLLRAAAGGDRGAESAFLEAVYRELHSLAAAQVGGSRGQVLQPTALVNEAWLKLASHLGDFDDRRHFLRTAGRAMRQVLANYAEAARARKRAGQRLELTTLSGLRDETEPFDAVTLEDALQKLGARNERHARVVELRFLCSFTIAETAEALEVSHATVESDWAMARAWLRRELVHP